MFEQLKDYSKILVCGPQRSGTRFCSKIIENDLDYEYVDERDYGESVQHVDGFLRTLESKEDVVIHCPAMTAYIPLLVETQLQDIEEDLAVVVMKRSIKKIKSSRSNIGWDWEKTESMKYSWLSYPKATSDKPHSIKLCYEMWGKVELPCKVVKQDYQQLSTHDMWVPESEREDFDVDQTKVEG